MRAFLYKLGHFLSLIYSQHFNEKVNGGIDRLYPGWILSGIFHVGHNVRFDFGSVVWGQNMIWLGDNIRVGNNTRITAFNYDNSNSKIRIKIGDDATIGINCHITAINNIEIGKGLLTGKDVLISDNAHGNPHITYSMKPADRPLYSKGEIHIGDNVWIGEKVSIMGGGKYRK